MDRVEDVMNICQKDIPNDEKIRLLEDLLLDLKNELEAQDQNMHPEIRNKLGEAYRIANQYLIDIKK